MAKRDSKQAKGGLTRAKNMTREQRIESARTAALARWADQGELPQATHEGTLELGDYALVCAVLPNGKRLLSQGTFLQAIGRSRTPKAGTGGVSTVDGIPFFLQAEQLKPFISDELMLSTTPIFFRLKSGQRAVGYDDQLLPMVCEVYLKYRDACLRETGRVPKQYEHLVNACDRLSRGLARFGIRALVDMATGYTADKAKEDVLKILAEYISPLLLPWTRRFPHEFFQEVYRLHGWEFKPGSMKHPQYVGKFINKYIYDPLPPGVLDELKRQLPKNEGGNRRAKLWQLLSVDTGIPHLDRQLTTVITIMRLSPDKASFERNFQALFSKQPQLPNIGLPFLTEGAV
jgi:hypothetical protein